METTSSTTGTPPMRSAIYARVSGHDDPRMASLDSQVQAVANFLTAKGFTSNPEDIFIERYTGTNLHDRPELTKLRQGVIGKKYAAYAVYCLDRLSREPTHLAVLFDEAERHGVAILSATEEIDSTPEGELLRNIRGYVAKVERVKILDRTARGTQRLLDQNKLICSGVARFGYRYNKENRSREIVPEEAEIVRRIFQERATGKSLRQIWIGLNNDNIPSPAEWRGKVFKRGKTSWTKDTITKILNDKSYIGEPMVWGKTRVVGRKKDGRAEVAFTDQHKQLGQATPSIVSKELWDSAHKYDGVYRTYLAPINTYKKNRMLSGMIYCGVCGSTMTTAKTWKWKKTAHYHWYICLNKANDSKSCSNPRMQLPLVEAEVWKQVSEFLRDKEGIKKAVAKTREASPLLDTDLELHRSAIVKEEAAMSRLVKRLGQEEDDTIAKVFRAELDSLSKSIQDHRQAIANIEAEIQAREAAERSVRYMEQFLASGHVDEIMEGLAGVPVGTTWTEVLNDIAEEFLGGDQRKREILQTLGTRVEILNGTVKVELAIPLVDKPGSPAGTSLSRYRIVL